MHLGVDAFVPAGTAVRLPSAGEVVAVTADQSCCAAARSTSRWPRSIRRSHAGDVVAAGDVVGRVVEAPTE